jgi:hypothetical protein
MWRMKFLGYALSKYYQDKNALPPDLNAHEDWALSYPEMIPNDWVTGIDRVEWNRLLFSCPGLGEPFIYRKSAAVGEVILSCSNDPQNSTKLEGWMIGRR